MMYRHESIKVEDKASSKMAERKDMLLLAQQKLDEINRTNLGLSGGRPNSANSRRNKRGNSNKNGGGAFSSHLLSTLLYLALMTHKVEDMKAMLAEEDGDIYEEWRSLLESLHSPEFHARERVLQNRRVKQNFERKRRYKEETRRLQEQLDDTSSRLADLQKMSNETCQTMTKTISVLQDERAVLVSKDEEKQYQIEELNEKIHELKVENEKHVATIRSLRDEVKKEEGAISDLNQELEVKDGLIMDSKDALSKSKQETAVANEKAENIQSALAEAKSQLESNEAKFENFRTEHEKVVSKMRQELSDSESRNAASTAQLNAANESLSIARQGLEDNRRAIESKIDSFQVETKMSFGEMKSESDILKNMATALQGDIAKVDGRVAQTEQQLKESNEHQKTTNEQTSSWIQSNQSLEKAAEMCVKVAEENDALKKILSYEKCIQESLALVASLSETASTLESKTNDINDALHNAQDRLSNIPKYENLCKDMLDKIDGNIRNVEEKCAELDKSIQPVIEESSHLKLIPDYEEMCTKLLERITENTNSLCERCTHMEDAIHPVLEEAKNLESIPEFEKMCTGMLDKMKCSIEDVTKQCSTMKSDYEEISTKLLKRITENTNSLCERCTNMEDAIHPVLEEAKNLESIPEFEKMCMGMLDKMKCTIEDITEQCSTMKSEIYSALEESKLLNSQVPAANHAVITDKEMTSNANQNTEVLPERTQEVSKKVELSSLDRTFSNSSALTAASLVDGYVSEAVSVVVCE